MWSAQCTYLTRIGHRWGDHQSTLIGFYFLPIRPCILDVRPCPKSRPTSSSIASSASSSSSSSCRGSGEISSRPRSSTTERPLARLLPQGKCVAMATTTVQSLYRHSVRFFLRLRLLSRRRERRQRQLRRGRRQDLHFGGRLPGLLHNQRGRCRLHARSTLKVCGIVV